MIRTRDVRLARTSAGHVTVALRERSHALTTTIDPHTTMDPQMTMDTQATLADLTGPDRSSSPILVFGDDGSEPADVAWLWINEHSWPGWRIAIVTAQYDPATFRLAPPELTRLHPWDPPRPRRLLTEADSVSVTHLAAEADPRLVLGQVQHAALLVIGRRGAGTALGLGSTADWLMHGPPTSLVIVRTARPAERILVCTDGSPDARQATAALAAMPWISGRQVTVLGVHATDDDLTSAVDDAAATLRGAGADVHGKLAPATPVHTRHRQPFPHRHNLRVSEVIHEVSAQEGVDLVVLGTTGAGLGHRILRGSVAAEVVHRAACSVLVARAPRGTA